MTPELDRRAAKMSVVTHVLVIGLLGLAFLSGVAVWWGQTAGLVEDPELLIEVPPQWVRPVMVFHGCLFPFLCGIFGYLVTSHFHPGWKLKANRVSGLLMDSVFLILIFSGVGLYYVGEGREIVIWIHRLSGAATPVFLGLHWFVAYRWTKDI